MNLTTALKDYNELGEYFLPDYERENEVLSGFKQAYPELSLEQVSELKSILENSQSWEEKYFVADLLYLYERFNESLLEPLLNTAIAFPDPSFNRIFLRPCVNAFGVKRVASLLTDKFNSGDIIRRIRIGNLVYWLRPQNGEVADELHAAILERAKSTDNLVELYIYKLQYKDKIPNSSHVPDHAMALTKAIRGNEELEDLLYNKLNWQRDNDLS